MIDYGSITDELKDSRKSIDAWKAFCTHLKPGLPMDIVVHFAMFGKIEQPSQAWSTDLKEVIWHAALECEEVTLYEPGEDDDALFACRVSEREYYGDGQGDTIAEAVCRALLDMFRPSNDELSAGVESIG